MGDVVANAEDREEDRMRTISSCERELDDIQGILEDLSTDIKAKMDEKSAEIPSRKPNERSISNKEPRISSIFTSSELTTLVECTEDVFEHQTNRMSITDLDLTQRMMQAELHVLQGYAQQNDGLDQNEVDDLLKKVSVLQDRMYRCITKRGQAISDNQIKKSGIENGTSSTLEEYKKESVVPKEVEGMSSTELEALLRHNSVDFEEASNREYLLKLVAEKLSPEVWDPPENDSPKWKDASSLDRRDSLEDLKLTSQSNSPTDSACETTPVESYFKVNPSDMENYLNYKIANDEKLVDWDPSPVLKELYEKITLGSRVMKRTLSKSKRVSCIQGYLEKLPMNQSKAKTFKGWKKRFFQISRGKLYYYEDHKSETPFGHINLLGSEIDPGEQNTININTKSEGKRLLIRCSTEAELKDWLSTLKRMAKIEPVPGTLTREGSLKKKKNGNDPVVIDIGASTIRAGLSTDTTPVLAFPAAFAVKTEGNKSGRRFTESGLPDPHSCRCGFEAFYPQVRKDAKIVYPLRPSLRIDKYSIKIRYIPGFLEKIFRDLELDSTEKTVVISHSRHLSNKDKEFLLDYLFGQMNVRAVFMQNQAMLSLYSYSVSTGLIVDMGDHVDILPVVEGAVIEKGTLNLPFAGQQITENLGKLLTESGYRLFTDIESYIVRYVKEEVASVSHDFQEDMTSSPNLLDVDIGPFELPDNKKVIKVGNIKYRCVEGLFNPGLWGKDVSPLQSMIERSIKACDIDQRRELCKNIYLSGGTSMLDGLCPRLEEELKALFPDGMDIKVTAGDHRLNAAYKGAIVVTGLPTFGDMLIKKKEWETETPESLLARWES